MKYRFNKNQFGLLESFKMAEFKSSSISNNSTLNSSSLNSSSSSSTLNSSSSLPLNSLSTASIKKLIVYGYTRVSTYNQSKEGVSLQEQNSAIRNYENINKLKVKSIIEETGSAYSNFPKILQFLLSMRNTNVLINTIDRFSRSVEHGLKSAKNFINKNGGTLTFIKDNIVLNKSSGTAVWDSFEKALKTAEDESKKISQRICNTKSHLIKQGFHIGGTVPWGYKLQPAGDNKHNIKVLNDEPNVLKVIHLIKLLRTLGTHKSEIDTLLKELTGLNETEFSPLEILDRDKVLNRVEFKLSAQTITTIFKQYKILNKTWYVPTINGIIQNFCEAQSKDESKSDYKDSEMKDSEMKDSEQYKETAELKEIAKIMKAMDLNSEEFKKLLLNFKGK